ncbi:hypothetical protein MLD38_011892 [Melastoma candidum]|uniref:Uncharacterized protein n=1 Tax=Melastoma candidum TaxID=119954 RepID=A0ACB9R5V0_9MYRT|nr:hypothetical protein MLD38_011892 [Melastoma candidum]
MGLISCFSPPDGMVPRLIMLFLMALASVVRLVDKCNAVRAEAVHRVSHDRFEGRMGAGLSVRHAPFESVSQAKDGVQGDAVWCCVVCLCGFEDEEEVSELSRCGHFFHRECLEGWSRRELGQRDTTCPLCRSLY